MDHAVDFLFPHSSENRTKPNSDVDQEISKIESQAAGSQEGEIDIIAKKQKDLMNKYKSSLSHFEVVVKPFQFSIKIPELPVLPSLSMRPDDLDVKQANFDGTAGGIYTGLQKEVEHLVASIRTAEKSLKDVFERCTLEIKSKYRVVHAPQGS